MMVDSARDMRSDITIGLVVPFATDQVPIEGPIMYPGVRFMPQRRRGAGIDARGLRVRRSTASFPAAEQLAAQGVDAIMVIGTSLTFYRGPKRTNGCWTVAPQHRTAGLTMSEAIVDGLRTVGAQARSQCRTAYSDEVNERLASVPHHGAASTCWRCECFGLTEFGGPAQITEDEIIALCDSVYGQAPEARGPADLLRRPAHARRGQAARGASRHSGRVLGHGGVLGGDAACRRERPYRRLWPVVRAVARAGELSAAGAVAGVVHIEASTGASWQNGAMKARVTVTLKSGILDPQGKAIEGALKSLGVSGVASVRQGKVFDIEIEGGDRAGAEAALKSAAEKLLANTVIENYRIEVTG